MFALRRLRRRTPAECLSGKPLNEGCALHVRRASPVPKNRNPGKTTAEAMGGTGGVLSARCGFDIGAIGSAVARVYRRMVALRAWQSRIEEKNEIGPVIGKAAFGL